MDAKSTGGAYSKSKGSAFERMICQKLSLWVTQGARSDIFWRSAMSGGRATVRAKTMGAQPVSGDITAVAPEGHALTDYVFIEAKHLKSLDITSFLLKHKGVLALAWGKARQQAEQHRKQPMLIARQNNFPIIVIVPLDYGLVDSWGAAWIPQLDARIIFFDKLLESKFRTPRMKVRV